MIVLLLQTMQNVTAAKRRPLSHDFVWVIKLFLKLTLPLFAGVVSKLGVHDSTVCIHL